MWCSHRHGKRVIFAASRRPCYLTDITVINVPSWTCDWLASMWRCNLISTTVINAPSWTCDVNGSPVTGLPCTRDRRIEYMAGKGGNRSGRVWWVRTCDGHRLCFLVLVTAQYILHPFLSSSLVVVFTFIHPFLYILMLFFNNISFFHSGYSFFPFPIVFFSDLIAKLPLFCSFSASLSLHPHPISPLFSLFHFLSLTQQ